MIYDITLTRRDSVVGHKRAQWSRFISLISSASLHKILEHMRRKRWAVCTGRIHGSPGAHRIQTPTEKSVSRQTQKSPLLCRTISASHYWLLVCKLLSNQSEASTKDCTFFVRETQSSTEHRAAAMKTHDSECGSEHSVHLNGLSLNDCTPCY